MILNRQRSVRLSKRALELFLQRVKRELRLEAAHVTVCLVSDAEIAGMNETFRKKQGPTDVLSFPANARPRTKTWRAVQNLRLRHPEEKFLGDIAIAPEVAKRNAQIYGRSLRVEMKILILHGVLHLLGYDHETDRGEMERAENGCDGGWGWRDVQLAIHLGILILAVGLPIFSYLTLIYRELGRMTTGRIHEHLEIFEAEIEPKLHIRRRSGGRTFRILGHFWLAFLVLETTRGIVHFVPEAWESVVQFWCS